MNLKCKSWGEDSGYFLELVTNFYIKFRSLVSDFISCFLSSVCLMYYNVIVFSFLVYIV